MSGLQEESLRQLMMTSKQQAQQLGVDVHRERDVRGELKELAGTGAKAEVEVRKVEKQKLEL